MVKNVSNVYSNIRQIKRYALEFNVPIMQDDTIDFVTDYIVKNNIKRVLEIGTAIGYSSIMMALSSPNVTITTIERDKERYIEALKNIKKLNLQDRITLVFNDALSVDLNGKYDLIIIDAAKSKNLDFFLQFEKNLDVNGSIITDNLNFHGYVTKKLEEIPSRNIRGLVKKIRKYKEFLIENENYKTEFYNIGDGISVSERRL